MEIQFCDICNESVPEADLAARRAVTRGERVVCARCEHAMSVPKGGAEESASKLGAALAPGGTLSRQARASGTPPPPGSAGWVPPPPSGQGASAVMGLLLASLAIVLLAVAAVLGMERLGAVEGRWAGELGSLRQEIRSTERSVTAELADLRRAESEQHELLMARATDSERSAAEDARERGRAVGELGRRMDTLERNLERLDQRPDESARNAGRIEAQLAGLEELRDDLALLARRLLDLEQAAAGGGLSLAAAPAAASAPEPDWTPLVADLEDDNASTRWLAVTSLGDTGDPLVAPHIVPRLKDDDIFVRMAAARILGDLRARSAIGPLIDALGDSEHSVREASVVSLRLITGQNFKFDSNESESDRSRRVKSWRKWWDAEQAANP